jgi:hypothetical protein
MSACRRTAGILDAWLDAGELSDRESRHLAGCPHCTAAFTRIDVADGEIRSAVRSLVLEAAAVGTGPAARTWHAPRSATPSMRFGAGLASLVAVVVLVVVAGIRISSTPAVPAGSAAPLLPVAVEPAEQALHQSGLRCLEVAAGLECTRRLSDGWQQVARLEVAGGAVRGLEVRLEPGTAGPIPVDDVAAALAEPATDVIGLDVTEVVHDAVACGCQRPIHGGSIHVEGDPVAGYRLRVEPNGTGS